MMADHAAHAIADDVHGERLARLSFFPREKEKAAAREAMCSISPLMMVVHDDMHGRSVRLAHNSGNRLQHTQAVGRLESEI